MQCSVLTDLCGVFRGLPPTLGYLTTSVRHFSNSRLTIFGCTFFVAVLSGCANFATMQTARTVSPGQSRFTIGGGAYYGEEIDEILGKRTDSTSKNFFIPYADISYREGISKHLDWGGRATIPGTIGLDIKYQWIDTDRFAAAVGGYLGYMAGPSQTDVGAATNLTNASGGVRNYFDLVLPLFFSFDVSQLTTLYSSPKYYGRYVMGGANGSSHLLGATLGLRYGDQQGMLFEISYFHELKQSDPFRGFQLSMGFFFGSAHNGGTVAKPSPTSPRQRRPNEDPNVPLDEEGGT